MNCSGCAQTNANEEEGVVVGRPVERNSFKGANAGQEAVDGILSSSVVVLSCYYLAVRRR